jgi:hypothetical protein
VGGDDVEIDVSLEESSFTIRVEGPFANEDDEGSD